jgi:hypothetical protein
VQQQLIAKDLDRGDTSIGGERRMYYRVALYHSAIQVHPPPSWQWKSTVLSSLSALFQFLRLHRALPQDRLRVFSSSSSEDLDEQLVQENQGLGSTSVTAAQFLQERMIHCPQVTEGMAAPEACQPQETLSSAVSNTTRLNEGGGAVHPLDERSLSRLASRRLELELGPGGDHDLPYQFTLPISMPQVLAWVNLLVRAQHGKDASSLAPRRLGEVCSREAE